MGKPSDLLVPRKKERFTWHNFCTSTFKLPVCCCHASLNLDASNRTTTKSSKGKCPGILHFLNISLLLLFRSYQQMSISYCSTSLLKSSTVLNHNITISFNKTELMQMSNYSINCCNCNLLIKMDIYISKPGSQK